MPSGQVLRSLVEYSYKKIFNVLSGEVRVSVRAHLVTALGS